MDAYERVLGDAMVGDRTLFAREDYVEEAWRIVDPVLKADTPVYDYAPGTWGPQEVDGWSRLPEAGRTRRVRSPLAACSGQPRRISFAARTHSAAPNDEFRHFAAPDGSRRRAVP